MGRKSWLSLVLAGLLAFFVVDNLSKQVEEPPADPAKLTVAELIDRLNGKKRSEAVRELTKRGWRDGPRVLKEGWAHPDPKVRSVIAMWCGHGNGHVAPGPMADRWRDLLLQLLEDRDVRVRKAAVASLSILVRDEACDPVPQRLVVMLRESLASASAAVRVTSCLAVGKMGRQAAELLDAVLAMDSSGAGEANLPMLACWALGSLGVADQRAQDRLLDGLRVDDPSVRSAAATALGQIGGDRPDVVKKLRERWGDEQEEPAVRSLALESLAKLPMSSGLADALAREALARHELFGEHSDRWVLCVTELVLRGADARVKPAAIAAMRERSEQADKDLSGLFLAVPGAIGRLAVAARDEGLLAEVMPSLREELEATVSDLDNGSWTVWETARQLVFEALVDACLWREDVDLRSSVSAALELIAGRREPWIRDWARSELSRLQGK